MDCCQETFSLTLMHCLIKAKTVGGDVTQASNCCTISGAKWGFGFTVSATNISWCVISGSPAIFKKQLAKERKNYSLTQPSNTLTVISLLDPQIKDYTLQTKIARQDYN